MSAVIEAMVRERLRSGYRLTNAAIIAIAESVGPRYDVTVRALREQGYPVKAMADKKRIRAIVVPDPAVPKAKKAKNRKAPKAKLPTPKVEPSQQVKRGSRPFSLRTREYPRTPRGHYCDDRDSSSSRRTMSGGLPTLGRGHR